MSYKNNIWKTWFIMWANQDHIIFWVYIIYMLFIWLSITEVSVVVSAWLIISSIWQIPWGIFADKYWYKTSIVIGLFIMLVWMIIFAFANSFILFAIWYSLNWFWSAMVWWADQALLYESMLQEKQEKNFKKVIGKIYSYINFTAIILCSLWWILYAQISPQTPFIIQIWISTLSLIVGLFLKSTPIRFKKQKVMGQITSSFKFALTRENFSKIFIFSAIIWSISITTNQFLQPFYQSINIDEKYFWLMASLSFLFWWLGSLYSNRLWKLFSIDHYLVLHASVFSLFLIILHKISNIPITVIIIAILFFLRWIYMPTISTFINNKVPSDKRATMLSINSQILFIASSLSLFGVWYIAENYSISLAFFWISILSIVFLIIYIFSLRKVKIE